MILAVLHSRKHKQRAQKSGHKYSYNRKSPDIEMHEGDGHPRADDGNLVPNYSAAVTTGRADGVSLAAPSTEIVQFE